MIRKTISKILLILIMVTMVIGALGQTSVRAAKKTESITLALSKARVIKNGTSYEDKGAYALNTGSNHPIYQIVKLENGSKAGTNFLCVNATRGVTWNNNTVGTGVTYDTSYDLATDKSAVAGLTAAYNNVAGTYYTQIMWLLDNILLGTDYTNDDVDELLAKAGIVYEDRGGSFNGGPVGKAYYFDETKIKAINSSSAFADTDSDLYLQLYGNSAGKGGYWYADQNGAKKDVKLSKELIEAVEQAAVWYFTNHGNTEYDAYTTKGVKVDGKTYEDDYGNTSDAVAPKYFLRYADGSEWKLLANKTTTGVDNGITVTAETGAMLQEQASILYNYLIDAANKAKNDGYTTKAKGTIKIEFAGSSTDKKITEDGDNYKVGPLKATANNATINEVTVTSGTSTTATSGVTLQNASGTTITKPTSGQNFYLLVPKSSVNGTIKVKVTAKTSSIEKKLRIKEVTNDSQAEQAIVEVTPKTENINDTIDIPLDKQFDLALRKTIVKIVDSKGTTKSILNEKGDSATRTINAVTSTIPETATYKHRKDPVVIENEDIVTFRITIYNEGEIDGYASKIVDQLPTGLESVLKKDGTVTSHEGNVYKVTSYDTTTNKLELTIDTEMASRKSIDAFNGTTLKNDYIELNCKVTGTAKSDGKTKQYLTNIAYIAEEYDKEGNKITADRDGNESKPTTSPNKTADELNNSDANNYKGKSSNKSVYSDTNNTEYYEGQEDDDDFEKLVLLPKEFDLKLMKFISAINDKATTRKITIDSKNLNKTVSGKKVTTADYDVSKVPLIVKTGDYVTYTFRIYNEGEVDGYASEITEDIPAGLEYDASKNTDGMWTISADGKKLTTNYLSKEKSTDNLLKAFDAEHDNEKGSGLSYKDVSVTLKVVSTDAKNIIRNEAEISEDTDSDGNPIDDRDSDTEEWKKEDSDDDYEDNPNSPKYKEDDEDYDNIKLATFDLALRKFISKVSTDGNFEDTNTTTTYNRAPQVDSSKLKVGTASTAIYNHSKEPILLNVEDYVLYTIRAYNEGDLAGFASQIIDYLPNYLDFVESTDSYIKSINDKWTYDSTTRKVTTKSDSANATTKLAAFDAQNDNGKGSGLSYVDVQIVCKVNKNAPEKRKLTNIAEITEYKDEDGNVIEKTTGDRDSKPENFPEDKKSEDTRPDYNGGEDNDTTDNYIPGQEDDDDFEKVIIREKTVDLALTKFITAVSKDDKIEDGEYLTPNKNIGSKTNEYIRATVADTTGLKNGTSTNATYTAKKDLEPLEVTKNSYILYNIRVYNEGEVDVYAGEIADYLPENLEFVDGEFNKQYGWTANGQTIKSRYYGCLADGVGPQANNALLKAFDKENDDGKGSGMDYKDLPVLCKVSDKAESGKKMVNTAEITKYEDKDGNEIPKDVDSEPKNKEEKNVEERDQDDDDYEVVIIKNFDLALRKTIAKIVDSKGTTKSILNEKGDSAVRTKNSDGVTIDIDSSTIPNTATYKHRKDPVVIENGDVVTFRITIYNEGEIDGYASKIVDGLPTGLESVLKKDGTVTSHEGNVYKVTAYDTTTNKLELTIDTAIDSRKSIDAFNGTTLKNDYIELNCKVTGTAKGDGTTKQYLTNIAYIAEEYDKDGNEITEDRNGNESKPTTSPNKTADELNNSDANNYKGNSDNKSVYSDTDNTEYYKGEEDDDDFEKLVILPKKIDLALTKFITAVSKDDKIEDGEYLTPNKNIGSKTNEYLRATVADTTGLKNGTSTNATYTAKKDIEPLEVGKNSYILYNIRVYNEGEVDVFAGEITDYLPENLEFVDGEFNKQYGWTANGQTVKTTYLSSKNGADKILKAFDKENDDGKGSGMDYKDLPVLCKVSDKAESGKKMVNTAEITKYEDKDGNEIPKDVDSEPKNKEEKNVEERDQDDDDYEVVIIKDFDLALRKFITNIGGKDTTARIPNLSYENGKITYTHPKDVLRTTVGDTVTYTLRVFNEGDIAGFAQEITDDIPEYLEFLPEDATNREYKWVMYDKDGNSTTKVSDAVKIKTDYTSKSNGEILMKNNNLKENPNLLKAFDKTAGITDTNPDYVDVKVAFKVKDPNSNKTVIVNKAQISDDADKDGNPVEDIDSKPDEWNDGEDDQDYENVAVDYFDLSLLKYVTKAIVTENGKTKTTKTGNNGSDKDITPKVEVYRKSVNKTIVKFEYTIKITNEGDIAGYAKEITDYVPKGLKFYKEDNKGWKDEGNNVISTKLLKDTLLQPGQSATVKVILRWVNGENNLGVKTNVAEISEDYNEKGVPDRDSTPDNKKPKEDDIDDAPVLLTISTGMLEHTIQYVVGALVILVVLGTGLVVIKKYVL